jgi:hypothetical protein
MKMKRNLLALAVLLTGSLTVSAADTLKVFILAGQSNMVGHSRGHTVATLYHSDSTKDKELIQLVFKKDSKVSKTMLDEQLVRARKGDELTGGFKNKKIEAMTDAAAKAAAQAEVEKIKEAGEAYKKAVTDSLVASDRVYINSISDKNKKSGKLSIGHAGHGATSIGPEYSFGLSIAEKIDGPILIIKTSWGGKSLNYDFRPPSAGAYPLDEKQKASGKVDEIKKNASLNYRMMNEAVHNVLDKLKDNHPAYDSKAGYEIAGFVWFQGYNDQFSDAFRDNYKDNMVNFIKDVRKEYKTPKMPFIIGVLGTNMTEEKVAENAVSVGQREAAKAPEFKGNVLAVESYTEYDHGAYKVYKSGWAKHYLEWDTVGSDRPYHYLGSGKFFVRLGDSFATSMAELISKQKK